MNAYEICAVVLIAGITAHLVFCYKVAKIEKILQKIMQEHVEKIWEITKRESLKLICL